MRAVRVELRTPIRRTYTIEAMKTTLLLKAFLFILLVVIAVAAQTTSRVIMETQWTADYIKYRDETFKTFMERSEKVNVEFKLADYDHWDFRQDTGQLVFSNKGVKKVVADVQVAGDWTARNSWMWAWNNDSIEAPLKKEMFKVRDFGKEKNYYELITPEFRIMEEYAWSLTAIAGTIIKAKGAYRGQTGKGGYIYFLITDLKWVK